MCTDLMTGPALEPIFRNLLMSLTHEPVAESICNVLYCSHATALMNDAELERIFNTSAAKNPARELTGLLVFAGGMFLQWLEGPREAVELLMTTLANDPRHETIVRLQELDGLHERLYPHWAMQKVEPADIREILSDCYSRPRSPQHAELIRLTIQLLDTDQLAALNA
jgi:Sensors of blue-light using FAD